MIARIGRAKLAGERRGVGELGGAVSESPKCQASTASYSGPIGGTMGGSPAARPAWRGGGASSQRPSRCASSRISGVGGCVSRTELKPVFANSASGSPR